LFRKLKLITYLFCLVAGYFAYIGAISWWWVLAGIAASALFKYLARPNVPAPLLTEEHDLDEAEDDMDGPPVFKMDIAKEIVMEFGQVMMRVNYLEKMYDVSELPLEKGRILDAFATLYRDTNDDDKRERFKLGIMALSRFREDIGNEPIDISLDPTTYAATEAEYIKNCLELEGP
jgi:hypothetical protein